MEYSECQTSLGCIGLMAPMVGLTLGILYIFVVAILDIMQANLHSYFRTVIAALFPWVAAPKDDGGKDGHLRYALRPVLGVSAMMAIVVTFLVFFGLDSDRITFSAVLATSFVAVGTLARRGSSFTIRWPARGIEWRIYPIASLVWHIRAGLWCTMFFWFMRFAQEVDL